MLETTKAVEKLSKSLLSRLRIRLGREELYKPVRICGSFWLHNTCLPRRLFLDYMKWWLQFYHEYSSPHSDCRSRQKPWLGIVLQAKVNGAVGKKHFVWQCYRRTKVNEATKQPVSLWESRPMWVALTLTTGGPHKLPLNNFYARRWEQDWRSEKCQKIFPAEK